MLVFRPRLPRGTRLSSARLTVCSGEQHSSAVSLHSETIRAALHALRSTRSHGARVALRRPRGLRPTSPLLRHPRDRVLKSEGIEAPPLLVCSARASEEEEEEEAVSCAHFPTVCLCHQTCRLEASRARCKSLLSLTYRLINCRARGIPLSQIYVLHTVIISPRAPL